MGILKMFKKKPTDSLGFEFESIHETTVGATLSPNLRFDDMMDNMETLEQPNISGMLSLVDKDSEGEIIEMETSVIAPITFSEYVAYEIEKRNSSFDIDQIRTRRYRIEQEREAKKHSIINRKIRLRKQKYVEIVYRAIKDEKSTITNLYENSYSIVVTLNNTTVEILFTNNHTTYNYSSDPYMGANYTYHNANINIGKIHIEIGDDQSNRLLKAIKNKDKKKVYQLFQRYSD